jgi:hypothetical protein
MRFLFFLISIALLTACSNTQLNVVDSLTSSAQNDGVAMHPSKWMITSHPLQTTYVSLNGQLAFRVGQVCITSRYRSPFSANCQNELAYSEITESLVEALKESKKEMSDKLNTEKAKIALNKIINSLSDAPILLSESENTLRQELNILRNNSKNPDSANNLYNKIIAILDTIKTNIVDVEVERKGKLYREYYPSNTSKNLTNFNQQIILSSAYEAANAEYLQCQIDATNTAYSKLNSSTQEEFTKEKKVISEILEKQCQNLEDNRNKALADLNKSISELPNSKSMLAFINAVNNEKTRSADFVIASTNHLSCLVNEQKKLNKIIDDKKADLAKAKSDEAAKEKAKENLSEAEENAKNPENIQNACSEEDKKQALVALEKARLKVEALAIVPNRVVYNWAKNTKWESGVVVQSESNSTNMKANKTASGYTVVDGVIIERYQMSCNELAMLKKRSDADRLKIVTTTLAAEELYYNANEETNFALNAAFSFTPKELKMLSKLKDKDGKELKLEIQTTINKSSSIASKGYLTAPTVTLDDYKDITIPDSTETETKNPNDIKSSLTYYAVLSDVETLSCN